MSVMSLVAGIGAAALFFFAADLVYTLDHYFVHHDRERYRKGHGRHHARYIGEKDAPQLDEYEFSTYSSAAMLSTAGMMTISLLTGNWGFAIGAILKYAHSLIFHCYQHKWWSPDITLKKQGLSAPTRHWGLSSAHYHAHHHAHPNDPIFTYSESWSGFDRILEKVHPWLVNYTVDGKAKQKRQQLADAE
jgi:hypothetical protein